MEDTNLATEGMGTLREREKERERGDSNDKAHCFMCFESLSFAVKKEAWHLNLSVHGLGSYSSLRQKDLNGVYLVFSFVPLNVLNLYIKSLLTSNWHKCVFHTRRKCIRVCNVMSHFVVLQCVFFWIN